MDTVNKVVLLPNEYKERMSCGYFDSDLHSNDRVPDSNKPLIYVTHPDDREDELWVPPIQEYSVHSDEDSDDGICSCLENHSDEMDEEYREKESMASACSVASQIESVANKSEMYFYRTGWQNRGVYLKDDRSSSMIYYVDIPWRGWGTSLTIRHGSATGDVMTEVHRKGPGRPFEITFFDPHQQPFIDHGKLILKYGCIYSHTHKFVYRGRNLAWKHGFNTWRLRDLDTDEILAEFFSQLLSIHMDGKLVILGEYAWDPLWVDVIATTALTCQQRLREIRRRSTNSGGEGRLEQ